MMKITNVVQNKMFKKEVRKFLRSNDIETLTTVMLYMVNNFDDWIWVQNKCIQLFDHKNFHVQGLAITCIGHLARIHGKIEKNKVIPILEKLKRNEHLVGRIEDALDDIKMFTK